MRAIEDDHRDEPSWLSLRRRFNENRSGPPVPRRGSNMTRIIGRAEVQTTSKCTVIAEHPSTLVSEVKQMLRRHPKAKSQDDFRRLARTSPASLARVLAADDLPPRLLTFAAEAGALVESPPPLLVRSLLRLLKHTKAYVREGAIYGLAPHKGMNEVHEALGRLAEDDPDDDIRDIVQEVLDA